MIFLQISSSLDTPYGILQNHHMKRHISSPVIMFDIFYWCFLACYLSFKILSQKVGVKLELHSLYLSTRRLLPFIFWKINLFVSPHGHSSFNLLILCTNFFTLQDDYESGYHLKCPWQLSGSYLVFSYTSTYFGSIFEVRLNEVHLITKDILKKYLLYNFKSLLSMFI